MSKASIEPTSRVLTKSFILFWMARVAAAVQFQMTTVAIGWFVYDKTQSAYNLGFLGLCQFLPMVVLTFVIGHVADRMDRRKIVFFCQLLETAIMLFFCVGAIRNWLTMPCIFAAVTFLGAIRAFGRPTLSALLPAIVPAEALPRAIAISTSAMQTASILGPSLGGLLYAFGIIAPFGVATLLSVIAATCLYLIKPAKYAREHVVATLRSVFSGVSFIWRRPVILGTISLDLFAVLLGGVTALMPIYARDILHAGPWGLGLLRSAPAMGALLISAILSRRALGKHVGLKMFASVIIFGLATIVFSASTNLVLSVTALIILGASDNVSVVIRSSLVQLATPDNMRGRVNAVNSLFIGTSNQLGEFESGMTAGLFGPVAAGIMGGVGTIIVAVAWMRLFPKIRTFSTLKNIEEF